ncbi:MAG: sulfite exporter TauE/SafE family protein [Bryobacteraceae bacterium]|jgi:uncharacterized membrane protein YfcA
MATGPLLWLMLVFFVTSSVSVITGSTSLITVPVMFQFGIEPRTAIATNMFALIFLSIGGILPFLRGKKTIADRRRLTRLVLLTLAGSLLGALLLLRVPQHSVSLIVSGAMIGVAIFSVVYRKSGTSEFMAPASTAAEFTGYALTFLLGIYGGFYSGGYVTILTAVYVALFRQSFVEAVATTKVINIFSSAIATIVFMSRHLIEYRLGWILGITMFAGALLGARLSIRLGDRWVRRIFLTAVWALGLKALFFDVLPSVSPAEEHGGAH